MKRIILLTTAILIASLVYSGCGKVSDYVMLPYKVTIGDAAHNEDYPGFYLLPPLVEDPDYTGVFDADLSPTISIPALGIEFTSDGKGAEYIRVEPEDEHYIVNWQTEFYDFDTPGVYEILFKVGDVTIGFIEIEVFDEEAGPVDSPHELNTNIQPGRTIPLIFRIESE